MSRELDPNLFGNPGSNASSVGRSKLGLESQPPEPRVEPGRPVPFPLIDLKVLEAQMTQSRVVMQQFDKRMDHLSARLGEVARDSQARLDQYGQQLIRLEEGLARLTRDTADRLAAIVAKVNERKVQDSKIQEMMDRHNLMVRNSENRMEALQKLTGDQEQALLSAFAALEDARAELARLKRL